jgi:hypothetical protein
MTEQLLFNLEFSYLPRITLGPIVGIGIIVDLTKGFGIIQMRCILQPPGFLLKPFQNSFFLVLRNYPLIARIGF